MYIVQCKADRRHAKWRDYSAEVETREEAERIADDARKIGQVDVLGDWIVYRVVKLKKESKPEAVHAYIDEIRNIRNAAHVIMEYASNHGEIDPDQVTWANVGSAKNVYADLIEICNFCGLEVKRI